MLVLKQCPEIDYEFACPENTFVKRLAIKKQDACTMVRTTIGFTYSHRGRTVI